MKSLFKSKESRYYALAICLIIISFLPLVMISLYNHPCADDFHYSIQTHQQWENTHSIPNVIGAAFSNVHEFYQSWDGLYVSSFVLALQPGLFDEHLYILTGWMLLFFIVGSITILGQYFIHNILQATRMEALFLSMTASFIIIQWMPSIVQGLFWYNGAMNYSFFHSLLLLLYCSVIAFNRQTTPKKKIFTYISSYVLAFLIEGGNQVTAFLALLFICGTFLFYTIQKKKSNSIQMLFLLLFTTICFLANVLSPGNTYRQEAVTAHMDALTTIKTSIWCGLRFINDWFDLGPIIVLIIAVPTIWGITQRYCKHSDFKFHYPLIVFILSIGWICAALCPPLYGMAGCGDKRLLNIIFYEFILLLYFNVFYSYGWFIRQLERKNIKLTESTYHLPWYIIVTLITGLLIAKTSDSWGYSAYESMRIHEAQVYSVQAYERSNTYRHSKGQDVIVKDFSSKPIALFFDDITQNPDDWRNRTVADFYGLTNVIKVPYED